MVHGNGTLVPPRSSRTIALELVQYSAPCAYMLAEFIESLSSYTVNVVL